MRRNRTTSTVREHPRRTKNGNRVTVKRHIRNNRPIEVNNDTTADVQAFRLVDEQGEIQDQYVIDIDDDGLQRTIISNSSEPLESIDVDDIGGGTLRVIEFEQDGDIQNKSILISDSRFDKDKLKGSEKKKKRKSK